MTLDHDVLELLNMYMPSTFSTFKLDSSYTVPMVHPRVCASRFAYPKRRVASLGSEAFGYEAEVTLGSTLYYDKSFEPMSFLPQEFTLSQCHGNVTSPSVFVQLVLQAVNKVQQEIAFSEYDRYPDKKPIRFTLHSNNKHGEGGTQVHFHLLSKLKPVREEAVYHFEVYETCSLATTPTIYGYSSLVVYVREHVGCAYYDPAFVVRTNNYPIPNSMLSIKYDCIFEHEPFDTAYKVQRPVTVKFKRVVYDPTQFDWHTDMAMKELRLAQVTGCWDEEDGAPFEIINYQRAKMCRGTFFVTAEDSPETQRVCMYPQRPTHGFAEYGSRFNLSFTQITRENQNEDMPMGLAIVNELNLPVRLDDTFACLYKDGQCRHVGTGVTFQKQEKGVLTYTLLEPDMVEALQCVRCVKPFETPGPEECYICNKDTEPCLYFDYSIDAHVAPDYAAMFLVCADCFTSVFRDKGKPYKFGPNLGEGNCSKCRSRVTVTSPRCNDDLLSYACGLPFNTFSWFTKKNKVVNVDVFAKAFCDIVDYDISSEFFCFDENEIPLVAQRDLSPQQVHAHLLTDHHRVDLIDNPGLYICTDQFRCSNCKNVNLMFAIACGKREGKLVYNLSFNCEACKEQIVYRDCNQDGGLTNNGHRTLVPPEPDAEGHVDKNPLVKFIQKYQKHTPGIFELTFKMTSKFPSLYLHVFCPLERENKAGSLRAAITTKRAINEPIMVTTKFSKQKVVTPHRAPFNVQTVVHHCQFVDMTAVVSDTVIFDKTTPAPPKTVGFQKAYTIWKKEVEGLCMDTVMCLLAYRTGYDSNLIDQIIMETIKEFKTEAINNLYNFSGLSLLPRSKFVKLFEKKDWAKEVFVDFTKKTISPEYIKCHTWYSHDGTPETGLLRAANLYARSSIPSIQPLVRVVASKIHSLLESKDYTNVTFTQMCELHASLSQFQFKLNWSWNGDNITNLLMFTFSFGVKVLPRWFWEATFELGYRVYPLLKQNQRKCFLEVLSCAYEQEGDQPPAEIMFNALYEEDSINYQTNLWEVNGSAPPYNSLTIRCVLSKHQILQDYNPYSVSQFDNKYASYLTQWMSYAMRSPSHLTDKGMWDFLTHMAMCVFDMLHDHHQIGWKPDVRRYDLDTCCTLDEALSKEKGLWSCALKADPDMCPEPEMEEEEEVDSDDSQWDKKMLDFDTDDIPSDHCPNSSLTEEASESDVIEDDSACDSAHSEFSYHTEMELDDLAPPLGLSMLVCPWDNQKCLLLKNDNTGIYVYNLCRNHGKLFSSPQCRKGDSGQTDETQQSSTLQDLREGARGGGRDQHDPDQEGTELHEKGGDGTLCRPTLVPEDPPQAVNSGLGGGSIPTPPRVCNQKILFDSTLRVSFTPVTQTEPTYCYPKLEPTYPYSQMQRTPDQDFSSPLPTPRNPQTPRAPTKPGVHFLPESPDC